MLENSLANSESKHSIKETSELQSHYIKFDVDPFVDVKDHYLFVKAVNPKTGYYAVSDIISFSSQEFLNQANFAKEFVEIVGEEISESGFTFPGSISITLRIE